MYALALSGPDPAALRDRLASGLAHRGPVAVVERADAVGPAPDGVASTYRLAEDGRYDATAAAADLDALLESLAADHGLALVQGFDGVDLPRVAVGVGDAGDALVAAPTLESLDPTAVDAALDDVEPIVTLESLVARVKAAEGAERAGAIATFTGRVRARDDPDDVETTALEFEKYEGVADERLADLERELSAREGVYEVRLHHRTGVLEAGEDIVFVVVLAGHRDEAFETVSDGIDRLKAEVPLFKKEVTVEDAFWVHERA
ncbi:MAG: molybdopterin synthase [Halobacteriales archaeon]